MTEAEFFGKAAKPALVLIHSVLHALSMYVWLHVFCAVARTFKEIGSMPWSITINL